MDLSACHGTVTRMALPGIRVSCVILLVISRPLLITIATPAALFDSGRGKWNRVSFVSNEVLIWLASSSVRWDSWIARTAILFLFKTPYISNHFSLQNPPVLLVLPRMLRVATFR